MAAPNFNGNLTAGGKPFFDVTFYGAKGDGTTDDGPAFTRAISAAVSSGCLAVYASAPAVSYYIGTAIGAVANGLTIFGPGSGSVTLKSGLTSGYLFDDSNARSNVTFRGLTFDLNSKGAGAIEMVGTLTDVCFEDLIVKNMNGVVYALHLGNVVAGSPTTRGARLSMRGVKVLNNNCGTAEACLIGAIDGVSIDSACAFSGCGANHTGLAIYGFNKNVVVDALFENNAYQDFYAQQSDNITIRGRFVEGTTPYGSGRSCSLLNCQHVTFSRECRFESNNSGSSHIWVFDYAGNFDGNTALYTDSAYIYDFADHSGSFNSGLVIGAQNQSDKNVRQTWIFAGGTYAGNSSSAIEINGSAGGANASAAIAHIRIMNAHILDGTWNSNPAIWLLGAGGSTITDVLVQGGSLGSNAGTGDGLRADNVTDVRVIDFDVHRNTVNPISTANGGAYALLKNVEGYTPFGAVGPPAVPNGAWLNNPYPYDCFVTISGGTGVGINVAAGTNGSKGISGGQTAGTFIVPAGGSIYVAYTTVPTWAWLGLR